MEIEIKTKKNNTLLEREEIEFKAIHGAEKTPQRGEIQEGIAKALGVGKERVVIDMMRPEFGKQETAGYAKVYVSKEKLLATERKHILGRNKFITIEKKAAAGKAATPKKEGAPAAKPAEKK